MSKLTIVLRDQNQNPIPNNGVILSVSQDGFTNSEGEISFDVQNGNIQFSVNDREGFERVSAPLTIQGSADILLNSDAPILRVMGDVIAFYRYNAPEQPAIIPLQRVHIDGLYAKTEDGKDFFFKGESAFLDYFRFLKGEDIRPLLEQSKKYGSNGRRNFWMTYNTAIAGGLGPCDPKNFPEFYDRIPEFHALYEEYGLYSYPSIFPDNGLFGYNDSSRIDHLNKVYNALRDVRNCFAVEWTNEIDAHGYNDINRDVLPAPSYGLPYCTGSMGPTGGDPMPGRQGSFCDFHQPRQYPNGVVDSCVANHPSRLHAGKAIMLGEPVGFGNKALNNNREDNPRIAKEIAGSAKGTAIGVVFHSQHGGFSQLYDDTEHKCATEWFKML